MFCSRFILSFPMQRSFTDDWWYGFSKHFYATRGFNQFSKNIFCGVQDTGSASVVNVNCSWFLVRGDYVRVIIYPIILYLGLLIHCCLSEDIVFWFLVFHCFWQKFIQTFSIYDILEVYSSDILFPCHPSQDSFKGPDMFLFCPFSLEVPYSCSLDCR